MRTVASFALLAGFCFLATAAHAQTEAVSTTSTTAPVPVNLGQSVVTAVLILGVSFAVGGIVLGAQLYRAYKAGNLTCEKIDYEWRVELLNQTPRKERQRRALIREEKARRRAEAEAAAAAQSENPAMEHDDGAVAVEVRSLRSNDQRE